MSDVINSSPEICTVIGQTRYRRLALNHLKPPTTIKLFSNTLQLSITESRLFLFQTMSIKSNKNNNDSNLHLSV